MSEFTELCRTLDAGDDSQTAAAVLAALRVRGKAVEVLMPVVANSVRVVLRRGVRDIEWSVMNQQQLDGGHGKFSYQDFLRETFALFDGRRVRWADATIADHEQRVAMLVGQRDGLNITIARHQAAIDQLRKTGAPCLGALVGAAA